MFGCNDFSEDEFQHVSKLLNEKLGKEYVSLRPGPLSSMSNGMFTRWWMTRMRLENVPYITSDMAIQLANDIFGPTGWSSEVRQFQQDYVCGCIRLC